MHWVHATASEQEADRKCAAVTRSDVLMFGFDPMCSCLVYKSHKGACRSWRCSQSTSDCVVPCAWILSRLQSS